MNKMKVVNYALRPSFLLSSVTHLAFQLNSIFSHHLLDSSNTSQNQLGMMASTKAQAVVDMPAVNDAVNPLEEM